mmetsp:Transcript_34117/g.65173  ORF Transcript_34117/g.65173 Transcript_34117/m.65173 type:complete len:169 (-) Transcript_34117:101-607(-)
MLRFARLDIHSACVRGCLFHRPLTSRRCFWHPSTRKPAVEATHRVLTRSHGLVCGAAMPQALPAAVAVYVTVPDKDTGKKVATALIESKLAACVNMIPGVESMYWWQGKVETDQELLLMIKSRASLVDQISAKVQAVHPYDTPEVIAVPITEGSAPYMKWLIESTIAE